MSVFQFNIAIFCFICFLIVLIFLLNYIAPTCPPGVPIAFCINAATACDEATCPNFPNARCVFDNCGGCNTKFFIGRRDVTNRCGIKLSIIDELLQ